MDLTENGEPDGEAPTTEVPKPARPLSPVSHAVQISVGCERWQRRRRRQWFKISASCNSSASSSCSMKRKRRPTKALQLVDFLSRGDPADDVVPASQLRNRRSARGREQIAPTIYSGGWRGMDDRMIQYGGASKYLVSRS
jgi:hypothetical protein